MEGRDDWMDKLDGWMDGRTDAGLFQFAYWTFQSLSGPHHKSLYSMIPWWCPFSKHVQTTLACTFVPALGCWSHLLLYGIVWSSHWLQAFKAGILATLSTFSNCIKTLGKPLSASSSIIRLAFIATRYALRMPHRHQGGESVNKSITVYSFGILRVVSQPQKRGSTFKTLCCVLRTGGCFLQTVGGNDWSHYPFSTSDLFSGMQWKHNPFTTSSIRRSYPYKFLVLNDLWIYFLLKKTQETS